MMRNKALLGLVFTAVIALTLYWALTRKHSPDTILYANIAKLNGINLADVQGHYFLLHFWYCLCLDLPRWQQIQWHHILLELFLL